MAGKGVMLLVFLLATGIYARDRGLGVAHTLGFVFPEHYPELYPDTTCGNSWCVERCNLTRNPQGLHAPKPPKPEPEDSYEEEENGSAGREYEPDVFEVDELHQWWSHESVYSDPQRLRDALGPPPREGEHDVFDEEDD